MKPKKNTKKDESRQVELTINYIEEKDMPPEQLQATHRVRKLFLEALRTPIDDHEIRSKASKAD